MLLRFADGLPFATGAQGYEYLPATGHDLTARLLLRVEMEAVTTQAIVDTGAPYVICAPAVARLMGLDPAAALGRARILIRGSRVPGSLHRIALSLPASRGDSLRLEATAFVPDPEWEEQWGTLPSFLGLQGCLERLRFAVDPGTDTFYFGPLT